MTKQKKDLYQEQYEYYKRENDVAKWTAILLFGVPLGLVAILAFMLLTS